MRITDERLVGFALQTLEDAAREALRQPVQRTFGIKLALAYLASRQDCERWPFDGFWKHISHEDANGRAANVISNLNGIYQQIGATRSF